MIEPTIEPTIEPRIDPPGEPLVGPRIAPVPSWWGFGVPRTGRSNAFPSLGYSSSGYSSNGYWSNGYWTPAWSGVEGCRGPIAPAASVTSFGSAKMVFIGTDMASSVWLRS